MTVTVELRGLELRGHHGIDEEERSRAQRFVFDLWLDVPADATRSDRLADAVDYRDVADVVRAVSDGRRFSLLEALAAAVAEELVTRFPVSRVRVRVRKPEISLGDALEYPAVSVELTARP